MSERGMTYLRIDLFPRLITPLLHYFYHLRVLTDFLRCPFRASLLRNNQICWLFSHFYRYFSLFDFLGSLHCSWWRKLRYIVWAIGRFHRQWNFDWGHLCRQLSTPLVPVKLSLLGRISCWRSTHRGVIWIPMTFLQKPLDGLNFAFWWRLCIIVSHLFNCGRKHVLQLRSPTSQLLTHFVDFFEHLSVLTLSWWLDLSIATVPGWWRSRNLRVHFLFKIDCFIKCNS